MNKLAKSIAALGMAGAAVLAGALPAAAAETPAAASAEADRLQGEFSIIDRDWQQVRYVAATLALTTEPNGSVWTMPAPGHTGPVSNAAGMCVVRVPPPPYTGFGWDTRLEMCNGSADQDWVMTEGEYSYLEFASYREHKLGRATWSSVPELENTKLVAEFNPSRPDYVDLSLLTPVVTSASVSFTAPKSGDILEPGVVEFSGEGEPGASIVVKKADGNVLCETTVAEDGTWSCTSSEELEDGEYEVTAEQTAPDESVTTDAVDFYVVNAELDSPMIAPGVVGAVVLAGAGALGGMLVRRRKA